ncbi:MAG: ABC transporter substrate-binding protein [Clostridia bacterium]|nr:ABC transporter substrate-binding protein [Clostridia bacterium]
MNKKIIAAVLTAALTLSFASLTGCNTAETNSLSENGSSVSSAEPTSESTQALEKTSFNLGHLNSTAHVLGFVAKEEGYFEEEGLDVNLTLFSSAAELSTGLESDKLDVAFIGSVPSITFQSQGHDLTIFGGAMTNGHGYVIKPEYVKDIDKWDVSILKGRNVASVKNSVQDAELQILLKDKGIEIGEGDDKVNIVYFDSQKDAYNALQNDTIDAVSAYSPYTSLAESQGYKIVYRCSEEPLLQNQPCCRQVASTEALSKYPNSYQAFERALIKAYKFTQENQEQTIKDVKKYIDIEEDLIKTELYGGYGTSVPDPDKQGTIALKNSIVELGYTEDYDIDKLYNTDVYKNALESLIKENPDDQVYNELQKHFDEFE